jgi:DNA-binding NtrC family response regulator
VNETPRLLVVDDDEAFRRSTAELLRDEGYVVETAGEATRASEVLEREVIDLVLLDVRMPGVSGLQMVEVLRARGSMVPIVMISGYGDVETAVESLHLGADDFLTKPVDPDELSRRVAAVLERRPAARRITGATHHGMVGGSKALADVIQAVRQVANSDATVLITGETGTGKELVARAIHDLSSRSSGPFVPVNCAALAEGLLESELFGHVRGAFTGATRDKQGLFTAADGGTLFLDEVGDMSLRLQQRLLRVLQEREAAPVGSTRTRPVDVRVVAATHRDLAEEARHGRFRDDLYYRLDVFHIPVPPLRERRADIPLLVRHALDRLRDRSQGPVPESLSRAAMRRLSGYVWPGNVRELLSAVQSAAIRAGDGEIGVEHLPAAVRDEGGKGDDRYRAPSRPGDERSAIVQALRANDGHRSRAADMLGMSRTTLWRRMKELGLDDPDDA